MAAQDNVLHSWTEIASHVGRGVRTVQRWERELDFPVHRTPGQSRSHVSASIDEVDHWLKTALRRPEQRNANRRDDRIRRAFANHQKLQANYTALSERLSALTHGM